MHRKKKSEKKKHDKITFCLTPILSPKIPQGTSKVQIAMLNTICNKANCVILTPINNKKRHTRNQ